MEGEGKEDDEDTAVRAGGLRLFHRVARARTRAARALACA
jgi:hypothetical protein